MLLFSNFQLHTKLGSEFADPRYTVVGDLVLAPGPPLGRTWKAAEHLHAELRNPPTVHEFPPLALEVSGGSIESVSSVRNIGAEMYNGVNGIYKRAGTRFTSSSSLEENMVWFHVTDETYCIRYSMLTGTWAIICNANNSSMELLKQM